MFHNAGEDILNFIPEFDLEAGADQFSNSGEVGDSPPVHSTDHSSCKRPLENPGLAGCVKQARLVQPTADVAREPTSISDVAGVSGPVSNNSSKNKK